MKVLVTGARGQLGRALRRTCPAGVELFARSSAKLDITVRGQVEAAFRTFRPETVINAAAFTAVDAAEQNAARAFAANDSGVCHLAKTARATGTKLVHASTDYVFDGKATEPYRPDAATRPLNTYGRSKQAGERHLAPSDTLVRTSWVHGAPTGNFVASMLHLMRSRDALDIVADQVSTPTSATSLANAMWQLALGDHPGVFHFADRGKASRIEFVNAIMEEALDLGLLAEPVTLSPVPASHFEAPAARPAYSVLDCRETYAALGWEPAHWRDGLRAELEALAAHG